MCLLGTSKDTHRLSGSSLLLCLLGLLLRLLHLTLHGQLLLPHLALQLRLQPLSLQLELRLLAHTLASILRLHISSAGSARISAPACQSKGSMQPASAARCSTACKTFASTSLRQAKSHTQLSWTMTCTCRLAMQVRCQRTGDQKLTCCWCCCACWKRMATCCSMAGWFQPAA